MQVFTTSGTTCPAKDGDRYIEIHIESLCEPYVPMILMWFKWQIVFAIHCLKKLFFHK